MEISQKELDRYRLYASEILGTFESNPNLTEAQKSAEIVAYLILTANRIRYGVKE
jgi:hypothetical protein